MNYFRTHTKATTLCNLTIRLQTTDATTNNPYNGQITVYVTNGTSPYTYELVGVTTSNNIVPSIYTFYNLEPFKLYRVNVTDANGCMASATASLQYVSPPPPNNLSSRDYDYLIITMEDTTPFVFANEDPISYYKLGFVSNTYMWSKLYLNQNWYSKEGFIDMRYRNNLSHPEFNENPPFDLYPTTNRVLNSYITVSGFDYLGADRTNFYGNSYPTNGKIEYIINVHKYITEQKKELKLDLYGGWVNYIPKYPVKISFIAIKNGEPYSKLWVKGTTRLYEQIDGTFVYYSYISSNDLINNELQNKVVWFMQTAGGKHFRVVDYNTTDRIYYKGGPQIGMIMLMQNQGFEVQNDTDRFYLFPHIYKNLPGISATPTEQYIAKIKLTGYSIDSSFNPSQIEIK
jgi:hypothetical protein